MVGERLKNYNPGEQVEKIWEGEAHKSELKGCGRYLPLGKRKQSQNNTGRTGPSQWKELAIEVLTENSGRAYRVGKSKEKTTGRPGREGTQKLQRKKGKAYGPKTIVKRL